MGEVKSVDISAIATGSYLFNGICAVGGKVVMAPFNAPQLLVFDVATEERCGHFRHCHW